MPSTVDISAQGLVTSPNPLGISNQGGLTVASNVIIKRDNIVETRRGFKLYGEAFGSSSDRADQLISYQNTIIRHFNSTLQFDTKVVDDNNESIFDSFSGSYSNAETGLRIKSVEANGNLYFTSSDGIQKISARTAADFSTDSGFITTAGGIKALDIEAKLNVTQGDETSFFTQDSAAAYRVVWGSIDLNNNLILGTPSSRTEIYNPLFNLLILDFNTVQQNLDNIDQAGSLINDGDYFNSLSLTNASTAFQLQTNLIALTAQLDADILLANTSTAPLVMAAGAATTPDGPTTTRIQVAFTSGNPTNYISIGDSVSLAGFLMTDTLPADQINGVQTVSNVTSTTIEFVITTPTTGPSTQVGTIFSNNYTIIPQPTVPDLLPTDAELVSLQQYLLAIIQRLQAELPGVIPTALQLAFITPLSLTEAATVTLTIPIPESVTLNDFVQIYRSDLITATGTAILSQLLPTDELRQAYEAYPTAAQLAAGFMVVTDVAPDALLGAYLYTDPTNGGGIGIANEPPPFALDVARFKNCVFYANTRTRYSQLMTLLGITNLYTEQDASLITVGNPTTITSVVHGFVNGNVITIQNSDSVPSIDGTWTISNVTANTFTIPFNTTGGVNGTFASCFLNNNASILFANTSVFNTYTFQLDGRENSKINVTAGSTYNTTGTASYFTLNSGGNLNSYFVWYYVNGGTMLPPIINGSTGIQVTVNSGDSNTQVANKTANALNVYTSDFAATFINSSVFVITQGFGTTTAINAVSVPSGFTVSVSSHGQGEDLAAHKIELSTSVSPAIAINATALSLTRNINETSNSPIYAFYISDSATIPGQINFQNRTLTNDPFYVLVSGTPTNFVQFSASFNPAPNPSFFITNTVANPTVVSTFNQTGSPVAHGLTDGVQVTIVGSNSIPSIDGVHTVSNTGGILGTTFTISVNVTVAGTAGYAISTSSPIAVVSTNDSKINRVYYSQLLQPEAVPLLNFFDVGVESKAILRIFPLRDSLFVFKEDGVFRISGEVAPFNLALFDSSTFMVAADSLGVSNNLIYTWTTQGIVSTSESGVSLVSRNIDVDILPKNTPNYVNFRTATWGVGYDSDNSYLVFTTANYTDTVATICYRFSTLTNSWTTYDKTNTCGVVNFIDDKLYMGAGDTNFIEIERKDFTRTDYADRELTQLLTANNYLNNGSQIKLSSVSGITVGDVLVQDQLLTTYIYNQLLAKLDLDPGLGFDDYASTLSISGGADLRSALANSSSSIGLAAKLDADPNTSYKEYLLDIASVAVSSLSNSAASPTIITLNNHNFTTGAVNTGTNTFTITSHGFTNNQAVTFTTSGTLPSGLQLQTRYFIINSSTNTFQVSATVGGSAVVLVSTGTGVSTIWKTHDLQNNRIISISGSNSTPSINGILQVTVLNLYQFSVPISVTTAGTTGSFDTVDDDFRDIEAVYNYLTLKLNADTGAAFNNYTQIVIDTSIETLITGVNINTNQITLGTQLPFVIGEMTVFKAIDAVVVYEPNHLQNPLNLKHVYEATMMFFNKAFTYATLSFASDFVPSFTDIPFKGDGNGIFGISMNFGGNPLVGNFFGGSSNGAPMRTYIPRNNQRCRYIVIKFEHNIARENFSILGISLTFNDISVRAYR